MTTKTYNFEREDVCTDCYMESTGVRENDPDCPVDREPLAELLEREDVEQVTAGIPGDDHECGDWQTCDGECEEPFFSSTCCPGCGSRLGGNRYPVTVHYIEHDTEYHEHIEEKTGKSCQNPTCLAHEDFADGESS